MSDVVSAIRTYILSRSAVSSLLGTRMYLDRLPQTSGPFKPSCTIEKSSETRNHSLGGLTGFVQTRLQIEVHSLRRLTSNAIVEAIINCGLDTLKGVNNGVDIRQVLIEDGQRNYTLDDRQGGDEKHIYVTTFDLMVHYLRN